jgi:hypothetical protein
MEMKPICKGTGKSSVDNFYSFRRNNQSSATASLVGYGEHKPMSAGLMTCHDVSNCNHVLFNISIIK